MLAIEATLTFVTNTFRRNLHKYRKGFGKVEADLYS